MKIFVDAMGGDRAPTTVVHGVSLATKEIKSDIVLVGDQNELNPIVQKYKRKFTGSLPEIVHASQKIDMSESPFQAVRTKKDSSIVKGLELTKKTPNSAFFSAGNSGAVMAAALMKLGRIKGVERPGISIAFPTLQSKSILLDAGAVIDCSPKHLVAFAHMGSIYAKAFLKNNNPKIGILSNGEELTKGTELTRATHDILKDEKSINYVGYVEGKDLFNDKVQVAVTDGYTGNLVLKAVEGVGAAISQIIQREFKRTFLSKMGMLFSINPLLRIRKKLDYAETGSAPLLGVDGNCFIGHGRSGPKAIKNGIIRAQEALDMNLHENLRAEFNPKN